MLTEMMCILYQLQDINKLLFVFMFKVSCTSFVIEDANFKFGITLILEIIFF